MMKHIYKANCCGHEVTHEDNPLRAGGDYRDVCPECGWITTYSCVESWATDKYGHAI